MPRNKFTINAFTIVELMVAVSILSIGMVLIIRSLLAGASALDLTQGRVAAITMLAEKMSGFDEKEIRGDDIKADSGREEAVLCGKSAVYNFNIGPIEGSSAEERLNEISLQLVWSQSDKGRSESLVTYAENKKE